MRVTIIGVGAMACLFGARLAPHAQIMLLGTWQEGVAAIRRHGIIVESPSGKRDRVSADATTIPEDASSCDLAIIARKAWQTHSAATQAAKVLAPEGLALTLQNGLGNLEILAHHVGNDRAVLGVTTQGASLVGPGLIRYAGGGATHIGATPATWARLTQVAELFTRAGLETHLANNVESLLWGKLAVNCGINALTALLRIPNGRLISDADAEELMVRAACECQAVARAKGIDLPFADAGEQARHVAHLTAINRSSMLQDVLRGAPTEIDAINGAVAAEGARLGVPTPTNDVLWRLVRAISNDLSMLPVDIKQAVSTSLVQ